MITSFQNPKIKWVRGLQDKPKSRLLESAFVVEGVRLVEEAVRAGWPVRHLFYTSSLSERGLALLSRLKEGDAIVDEVSPAVLRRISDTQTPQGILAVVSIRQPVIAPSYDFVLIIDSLRDPGNMGTILRTAAAAGVQAVFVAPGSVDVYAPKVVRAAMGAHFRVPILVETWEGIRERTGSLQVFLADVSGGVLYDQTDFCSPLALVIGGEAEGASPQAQSIIFKRVKVPMPGGTESLNAAVAAGILLFEVVRQRRAASRKFFR